MEKWYERVHRYGQTNLTEIDPELYDPVFWREFWKKTGTQAIIVNAGGIVAYYPSKFEYHYRAARLGGRDFFGGIVAAAREEGLAVVARMDINRAVQDFYRARPEWFARRKDGAPFITQGRYLSCLNSGYYKEFIPEILKEIIERYHPDGFTDNSWTGIPRKDICYCDTCRRDFREYSGYELPETVDYHDPVYRKWIRWNYACRVANWDLFNRVTTAYGGEDCLWLGMVSANAIGRSHFTDLRELAKRTRIFMVDSQGRDDTGFEQNSLNGLLLHQLAGWDVVIPESSASYVRGLQAYRRSASSPLELRLWMLEGIAGGISPWWHIIGSSQEDKRIFGVHLPILEWHRKYEAYLYNRRPLANVGILWSQENVEYGGGLMEKERVQQAWRGIVMALTRAGIPFLPINAGDIDRQTAGVDLLILPELAVVSDDQVKALEGFVNRGGSIFACGETGFFDEDGEERPRSGLESLLGLRFAAAPGPRQGEAGWENPVLHNYLRIERPESPVFAGFDDTAIIPMGGTFREVIPEPGVEILATYMPPFPIYPPEFAWTAVPKTDKPVVTLYNAPGGGKALYAAWDLDAVYGRAALPDHGNLIGNAAAYLLGDTIPFRVACGAYIDFKVYRQENRLIIHLINSNHTGFTQGYAERNLPVGPVAMKIKLPGFHPAGAEATEDGERVTMAYDADGSLTLGLDRLGLHQLIIVE
ncbi:MAG: beta-galactosidase [Treponema sp.]|jgi:hypothetical protein|nr:beta-galactosidase [Treponema sp.]